MKLLSACLLLSAVLHNGAVIFQLKLHDDFVSLLSSGWDGVRARLFAAPACVYVYKYTWLSVCAQQQRSSRLYTVLRQIHSVLNYNQLCNPICMNS